MPAKQPAKPAPKAPAKGKAQAASKAVVLAKPQPLSTDVADLLAQDAGAGLENLTRQDLTIPRLGILQDLSPQVKKTESAHIEDAEAGQVCDYVNEALYSGEEGILVVPVSYRRAHIEFKQRKDGGGFVKDHGTEEGEKLLLTCKSGEKGENILPNGNILQVIGEYFVFLVNKEEGTWAPYVIGMGGVQLKKSKRWNSVMNGRKIDHPNGQGKITPPMFYSIFRLTTVPERNDKGSWFGWKIELDSDVMDLPTGKELYLAARAAQLRQ